MSTKVTKDNYMKWQSNAEWPDGNQTKDYHHSEETANVVCERLKSTGMGGMREIFPTRTWVTESDYEPH